MNDGTLFPFSEKTKAKSRRTFQRFEPKVTVELRLRRIIDTGRVRRIKTNYATTSKRHTAYG